MYIIFNITGLKFDNVSNYQKGEQNYTCGEKNKSEYPSITRHSEIGVADIKHSTNKVQ